LRRIDTVKQSRFSGNQRKKNQPMKPSGTRPLVKPRASPVADSSTPPAFAAIMLGLPLLTGCSTQTPRLAGAPLFPLPDKHEANPAPESAGPTLHLGYGRGASLGNPVSEFMYFVPLISLEPVSVVKSPGNTQRVRMVSATRSFTARSFVVTCDFEFDGGGSQRDTFDHTGKVRRHERELKDGGSLDHQLGSINVEGPGSVSIEV
jgi:hypothetical protein